MQDRGHVEVFPLGVGTAIALGVGAFVAAEVQLRAGTEITNWCAGLWGCSGPAPAVWLAVGGVVVLLGVVVLARG